jgi:hypothetical protein
MFDIAHQPFADYCKPVLWGCQWQSPTTTFGSCDYLSGQEDSCPYGSELNYQHNIKSGQLWRMRTQVCAYAFDGSADCGAVWVQVQF